MDTLRRKTSGCERSAGATRAAIGKRSFELNFRGGTVWCEHLDGMGHLEQEVIDKFYGDIPKMLRSSVSSSMIIDLDETVITGAVEDAIVNRLAGTGKKFRKIAFVGVDKNIAPGFMRSIIAPGLS